MKIGDGVAGVPGVRTPGGMAALLTTAASGSDAGRPYSYPDACVVGLVFRDSNIASLSCGDNIGFSPPASLEDLKKVSADPPASFEVDITTGLPISLFNIVVLLTAYRFLRRRWKHKATMMAATIATAAPALIPAMRAGESVAPPPPSPAGLGLGVVEAIWIPTSVLDALVVV
jgi:hypothetical protein